MSTGVLSQAIDPASDRAVYKQIADHLRAAIAQGRLGPGDQLPSEAQLMAHYGVARMTARNALRLLQDEGHDAAGHVLVDAGEGDRLDVEPGFLFNLAAKAVVDALG